MTELHWVEGPWAGKLAVAARPRGGDWLPDELHDWHRAGVDTILSMLTPEEERDLDIGGEQKETLLQGMQFLSFPVPDRQVPARESDMHNAVQTLESELRAGRNVLIHCRQGIGRTGLVAVCLLIAAGTTPERALTRVTAARGVPVPETQEQRKWIERYAMSFAHNQ